MKERTTDAGPERAGDSVLVLREGLGPEAGVGAESVASWKTETEDQTFYLHQEPPQIKWIWKFLIHMNNNSVLLHLCWCSTSSSMLRCSEKAGPSDPRLPRLQEGGGTTCLVRPLILFNPRSPLVRVFFLSWRKALSPVEGHGKVLHNTALTL